MNFHQLRHFVVTAETGNILKASEALYISQSGLSRSIGALEHQLGLPLFERSAKGVELTPFGAHFFPSAKVILNEYRRSIDDLKAFRDLRSGSLTLGTNHSFAYFLIPGVVSELVSTWPLITTSIVTANYHSLAQSLAIGDVDLAFSLYTEATRRDDLDYEPLLEIKTRVFARPDHPLARLDRVGVAELRDAKWALINGASARAAFDAYFAARDVDPPQVSVLCASVALLASVTHSTDLLTTLPEEIISHFPQSALCPLPVADQFGVAQVGLIRRQGVADFPIAEKVAKLIRLHAARLRAPHTGVQVEH